MSDNHAGSAVIRASARDPVRVLTAPTSHRSARHGEGGQPDNRLSIRGSVRGTVGLNDRDVYAFNHKQESLDRVSFSSPQGDPAWGCLSACRTVCDARSRTTLLTSCWPARRPRRRSSGGRVALAVDQAAGAAELEVELADHLGYERHQERPGGDREHAQRSLATEDAADLAILILTATRPRALLTLERDTIGGWDPNRPCPCSSHPFGVIADPTYACKPRAKTSSALHLGVSACGALCNTTKGTR